MRANHESSAFKSALLARQRRGALDSADDCTLGTPSCQRDLQSMIEVNLASNCSAIGHCNEILSQPNVQDVAARLTLEEIRDGEWQHAELAEEMSAWLATKALRHLQ
jgi:hypothetical protein